MDNLSLAYLLIAIGVLVLLAEIFIPSAGLLFVLGMAALVGGIVLAFREDTSIGWLTLTGVIVCVPVAGSVLFHYWPKTRLGKRFFLTSSDEDATVASMPTLMELEQLRGRLGRTLSSLRPSGVVDFDGRRIDTITEGMMVEPDHWVRCIDVRAGRVVVRPVDKPDLGTLENADFEG